MRRFPDVDRIPVRSRNFLFGFAKNKRDNIDDKQLMTLREIVTSWFAADDIKIAQALRDGLLIEVEHGKEDKLEPSAD